MAMATRDHDRHCDNEKCENEMHEVHVEFPMGTRIVRLCGDCFNNLGENEVCETRGCDNAATMRFVSPYTAEVRTFCNECYELIVYGDDEAARTRQRMKGLRCEH